MVSSSEKLIKKRAFFINIRFLLVVVTLLSATGSFTILLGLTPIHPEQNIIKIAVFFNSILVLCLFFMIILELLKLLRARRNRKAAARLHVRIVGLFSIVAITPAILVAVIATLTLDVGLDRWFSIRTKAIVNSSLSVAKAYELENARNLRGQALSMGQDLDSSRSLYFLDRNGFLQLFNRQALGRGLIGAQLVKEDGSIILKADLNNSQSMPNIPEGTIDDAETSGLPALISSGRTNLVGAVLKLRNIPDTYLYVIRSLDNGVIRARTLMEAATLEYNGLEEGRATLQIAFAVLFTGFALILLLSAIWMAIAVADRLVRPIRRLITASDEVAAGDLNIKVPVHSSDGDVGSLSITFNNMISDIRAQRDEIITAKDQIDDRRRFTETVLTGVSAGVIGINSDRKITIANKSAAHILNRSVDDLIGQKIEDVAPGFVSIFVESGLKYNNEFRSQVTMANGGKEYTLDVKVTRDETSDGHSSYVVTVDDITDLMIAQRSAAWADIARRIAHEIKNPLTPIQLSAERIRRRFEKNIPQDGYEVFNQCINTIIRQVGDIGQMVNEFSSFARMPKPVKKHQDLRAILKDAIFTVEVTRSDIRFEQNIPDVPLMGDFDARMLGQAFGNLIKNATEAIDAIPDDQPLEEKHILISARLSDNNQNYVIDIIDNGNGLPHENRNRLLEPYMTLRDKGTGLGLAIVKKIAEDHGGFLEIHDAPEGFCDNKGAMFRVILAQSDKLAVDQDMGSLLISP